VQCISWSKEGIAKAERAWIRGFITGAECVATAGGGITGAIRPVTPPIQINPNS